MSANGEFSEAFVIARDPDKRPKSDDGAFAILDFDTMQVVLESLVWEVEPSRNLAVTMPNPTTRSRVRDRHGLEPIVFVETVAAPEVELRAFKRGITAVVQAFEVDESQQRFDTE